MQDTPRTLLFIAGYAGAGKTMIGKIITSKLRGVYIDKDTITKRVIEEALRHITGDPNDRLSEFFLTHFKMKEYDCMLDTAWENLKLNPVSVLVAPFTPGKNGDFFMNKEWVAEINRQCRKINANWHVIWVTSTNDTIRKMLINRKTPRDEWKLNHWDEYTKMYPDHDDPHLPIKNYTVFPNDGRNLHEIERDIDKLLVELGLTTTPAD